jgi:hypothetical protein
MSIINRGIKKILRYGGYTVNKIQHRPPTKTQIFSIGLYEGNTPLQLSPKKNLRNPVIMGGCKNRIEMSFVADPFMFNDSNVWYMFFELWNRKSRKGEIGLSVSDNLTNWKFEGVVLAEPFHISYPYIFKWDGEIYMIPETRVTRSVRLYKAIQFPNQWKFCHTLLSGEYFADASIVHYDGGWWIFTATDPEYTFDTLRLYYTADLFGAWKEHPKSPVINRDPRVARPAGRPVYFNGQLIRFAQDCRRVYGLAVNAFIIKRLTTLEYEEEEYLHNPILFASGLGWNSDGMHHIDVHRQSDDHWIAAVDGWYLRTS